MSTANGNPHVAYHSGKCDMCNTSVDLKEKTCSHCGSVWHEEKGDSQLMHTHLSAAFGCAVALVVYVILLVSGPFWLGFFLILLGLGGVPSLIYWFGRSITTAIVSRPKKTYYWKPSSNPPKNET